MELTGCGGRKGIFTEINGEVTDDLRRKFEVNLSSFEDPGCVGRC